MIDSTVKLGIYSTLYSAEEINGLVGMNYDRCWVMGMPRSPRSDVARFEQHAWFLVADPALKDLPVNEQIAALLERVEPALDRIADMHGECEIIFNCEIIGDENPELSFSKEVIHLMSKIHANLDIDLFIA